MIFEIIINRSNKKDAPAKLRPSAVLARFKNYFKQVFFTPTGLVQREHHYFTEGVTEMFQYF